MTIAKTEAGCSSVPLEPLVRAYPVKVLSPGSWLCTGADGAIHDWLMSDGTVATLSMREVFELRSNVK